MRGTRPLKRPELLMGHRRHRALVAVDATPTEPPPPAPAGLLPGTGETWERLWTSFLAGAWNRDTDLPAIARYVLNLDKWCRYEEMVAKVPMVKGSKGQLRSNPLAGRMDALEGQLRFTEEQYGLTPASRIRLGLEIMEHRRSLAEELLARLEGDFGEPTEIIDLDDF
jgi:P27 family predicted phage terminase small subunit